MAKRTDQQRKAIEVFCRDLAEQLNAEGLDIRKTLKADFEIAWTQTLVKELMVKPMCKALFDYDSTTQLSTGEVMEMAQAITNHLAANKSVYVEFPGSDGPPVDILHLIARIR